MPAHASCHRSRRHAWLALVGWAAAAAPAAWAETYVATSATAVTGGVCITPLTCDTEQHDSRSSANLFTNSLSNVAVDGPDSRHFAGIHASAVASADLATGALRARAFASDNVVSFDPLSMRYDLTFGHAGASASFADSVTLHVAPFLPFSQGTTRIGTTWYKDVRFTLAVTGSSSSATATVNPYNSSLNYGVDAGLAYTSGSPLSYWASSFNSFSDAPSGGIAYVGASGPSSFSSSYYTGPSPTLSVDVFALAGDTLIDLSANLSLSATGMDVNYSHTALLNFQPNAGVSIASSGSGVLLSKVYDPTSPIPEPSSAVMTLLGLVGIAFATRRRRLLLALTARGNAARGFATVEARFDHRFARCLRRLQQPAEVGFEPDRPAAGHHRPPEHDGGHRPERRIHRLRQLLLQ